MTVKHLCQTGTLLGLALMTGHAFAFTGCIDSPENPTLILGALGGAAASLPWLKAQLRARLNRHDQ